MKRLWRSRIVLLAGTGGFLLQGCPVSSILGGLISDCFGEETISASEFDDLNPLEQLLYEENDCGRYEPVSNSLDDLL